MRKMKIFGGPTPEIDSLELNGSVSGVGPPNISIFLIWMRKVTQVTINYSKNAPHLESANTLGVLVQTFKKNGQKGFQWIPVGNTSFDQRTELARPPDPTLDSMKRYGTILVHRAHFFATQRRCKEKWWGWLGGELPWGSALHKTFFLDRAPACP